MKSKTITVTALIAANLFLFIVSGQAQQDRKYFQQWKAKQDSIRQVQFNDSINQVIQERVFFFAQKMAIEGDVRIKQDPKTKKWTWIKSPWNNGKPPIYKPTE